jgi:uncharacterized protein (TIGR02996 family)
VADKKPTKKKKASEGGETVNAELEAQIAANPDDLALRQVYADWLIEAGNPRGELAAVQLAGNTDAAAALLAKHANQFFGTQLEEYAEYFTWCGGFWDAVEIDNPFKTFPNHPSARLLRAVKVRLPGEYEDYIDWFLSGSWPALRSFSLGGVHWEGQEMGEEADWSCTNLDRVLAKLPRLEELTITCGKFSFGDSATLRAFTCDGYALRQSSLRAILAAKLPALEKLELMLDFMVHEEEYPIIDAADLEPLFSGKLFPALRELALTGGANNELAKAAKASPLARRAAITIS